MKLRRRVGQIRLALPGSLFVTRIADRTDRRKS
jgi:hypothetical protein